MTDARGAVRRPSGLSLILAATGMASLSSYLVIWLVPLLMGGFAAYRPFGVFWAAMYFAVGGLAGIQQEVTRATVRRTDSATRASPARNFGLLAAFAVFVVTVGSAPAWVGPLFDGDWALVLPLAFAASTYVMVATLAGTLYGIAAWVPVALMISVDAALRLAAVLTVAALTDSTVAIAWAAAVPFPAAVAILWPGFRRIVVARTTLDVGYRALTWNASRTLIASGSAGVLISGLPVLIDLAGAAESPAFVAGLFTAITITRAPVIVIAISLQSYLIVQFRHRRTGFWRLFLTIQGAIVGASLLLGGAAVVVGPAVFDLLYGGRIDLPSWLYGVLVVSSGLVASLVVSATAVLSASQHFAYSLGWLGAAVATGLCFALPADLTTRTVVALIIGPVVGLGIHAVFLASRRLRVNSRIDAL